jgi:hypothetical protein
VLRPFPFEFLVAIVLTGSQKPAGSIFEKRLILTIFFKPLIPSEFLCQNFETLVLTETETGTTASIPKKNIK